eukprot:7836-Heterococcus_DN1.PRE.8
MTVSERVIMDHSCCDNEHRPNTAAKCKIAKMLVLALEIQDHLYNTQRSASCTLDVLRKLLQPTRDVRVSYCAVLALAH